jgi:acetyl-CoA decarbonylase/synthase complex subunit delta
VAFEIPKITYSGEIKEIALGQTDRAVTVGGESSYPFHLFEGEMPHLPRIAMEVYDCAPQEWPQAILEPFQDVIDNPVAWAKKCINKFNAELICLRLASTDPNGLDKSADEVAPVVKEVAEAIEVPLIVWGCENDEKDAEVLTKIAEVCQDKRLILGPATDKNYKKIGAVAIAYKHTVVASTPIDINLAKQLNILLGDLGLPDEQIIVDPNTGGCSLGYGIEYTYSVMERDRQAALTQQDKKLQFPMIANFATDVWKKKEVKISQKEDPKLGDEADRGVLLEALTGVTLLLAGADLLIMGHPEAIKLVRSMVNKLSGR